MQHDQTTTGIHIRNAERRDLPRLKAYFEGLSDLARRNRFHVPIKTIRDELIEFMLNRSRCAMIAEDERDNAIVGEALMAVEPEGEKAETALSVADGWRGRGLGDRLLRELEARAKAIGARVIYGDMLGSNALMKKLAERRSYEIVRTPGDWSLSRFRKKLADWTGRAP